MAHWPWTGLISEWFGAALDSPSAIPDRLGWWFKADAERDARLLDRYGQLVEQCAHGALYHWLDQPQGRLALILDGVAAPFNVGAIIRTAAAERVNHLWFAGGATTDANPATAFLCIRRAGRAGRG